MAFSRSGTTVKLFADGAQVASGTVSSYTSQDNLTIGYLHSSSPYYFNGYISNVRILNGVALYTDSFTPPTGSLSKSIPIGSSGYASNSMIFSPSYVYVTNSNFAPSSIKICSGAITFTDFGIGCEVLSVVIKLKSSRNALSFFAKISQVFSICIKSPS